MSEGALDLVRTRDSAVNLDAGPQRYATADGYTAEVTRSTTAPGRLTVKVYPRGGAVDYLRADDMADALSTAADRIRQWRLGEPLYPLRVPAPAVA